MAQNYVLLERIELNASAASVTFSNIPQSGYTDLKVVSSYRGTGANVYEISFLRFNGLTTNLSSRSIEGNGSSASSFTNTHIYFGAGDGASATANTFSNIEAYIPNYTSSNYKSVSIDAVGETNGTTIYMQLTAGLWSNTAAITSIEIVPANAFVANSTFSLYGLAAVGTTPAIAPKASGGNITTDGTYWIHTFLTTEAFTPFTNLTCDYLVVAGGGGGGGGNSTNATGGGGGGAGGYLTSTGLSVTSATTYTIQVGGGGSANTFSGTAGTNSIFSTVTSTGGGGGGSESGTSAGGAGGSGAGGTNGGGGGTRTASPVQGNNGGGSTGNGWGGGGGGAGAAGSASGAGFAGAGGNGSASSISGTSVTYAGGGGGGGYSPQGGAAGGSGGGGRGGDSGNSNITAGTANTGGGGGGSDNFGAAYAGRAGGSGIVIIRYPIA